LGISQKTEKWLTIGITSLLTFASTILMLRSASAELSWDEADYASNISREWRYLWSQSDYPRHGHGPLAI
jgi:hypothetical protein